MKTLGIISEFNPFHNGHEYLIKKSNEITQADLSISLMSGDYVQRGEAAIIDKHSRASNAMKAGFDMVVEMPVHISLQSAEYFALGSVKILDKLDIDYLCFGIENMDSDEFLTKANILIEKSEELEDLTRKYLENSSFTKARYDATVEILRDDSFITSNNILALEYIRAIHKIKSKIKAIPIKRISSANSDKSLRQSKISSSTAIRANIFEDYKDHVPSYSYETIEKNKIEYGIHTTGYEYDLFRYLILLERRPMAGIMGYEEGIESYLLKLAKHNDSYNKFLDGAATARYTKARIKRLILNYILENKSAFNMYDIGFFKVLAFNESAQRIFKNTELTPVLTKSDESNLCFTDQILLSKIIDASNLYALGRDRELFSDYTKKIGRY